MQKTDQTGANNFKLPASERLENLDVQIFFHSNINFKKLKT